MDIHFKYALDLSNFINANILSLHECRVQLFQDFLKFPQKVGAMSSSKRKHSDVGQESDNEGKSRNRSVTKERERQWQTVDSSSEDGSRSSGSDSSASDSSSDDSSGDERRNKRDRKESKDSKKSKKESKHKKSKKDKKDKKDKKHKHKKDHKKDKKERKEKKDSSSHKSVSINQNEYGKYGIIKEENIFHKQR